MKTISDRERGMLGRALSEGTRLPPTRLPVPLV